MNAGEVEVGDASDEEIVARILGGQRGLFEVLMRRNNRRLYRAAWAVVRDDGEAEDVVQDAYVRAFEHLRDFEGRARFSTWLTRIVIHESFARVRRRGGLEPIDLLAEAPAMLVSKQPDPEQRIVAGELRAVIERAIAALPREFRLVFVLRAVEELSGAETAQCLGITEETVRSRFHRARNRLMDLVREDVESKYVGVLDFAAPRCDRVVGNVLGRLGVREGQ